MLHRLVSRESLILAIFIWTSYALLEFWVGGGFGYLPLIWTAHGFVLMLLLGAVLDRVLRNRSSVMRFAVSMALALSFALAQTLLDLIVTFTIGKNILHALNSPPGIELSPTNYTLQTAAKLTFKFYIWLFGFYAAILALMAATRDKWRARVVAERAQIEALRLQLNPHFLFNALSSMDGLMALKRTEDATRMLHSLSDFYRSTLLDRDDRLIPLREELEVLEDYAAVEQIRFGDRLRLAIEDAGNLDGVLVPPLLLQPLVENAIKHGDDGSSAFQVEVAVRLDANRVTIIVRNPLRSSSRSPGTGTGLVNVRRRLGLLYGAHAGLEAGPDGDGWQARVWLPRGSG